MTLGDVKSKYERDLNRICDALRIPYETAVLAMRQFNWYSLLPVCVDPVAARCAHSCQPPLIHAGMRRESWTPGAMIQIVQGKL